jgi:hypothetical protein
MLAMETIICLSFDDTLPVPALARPFALPRESVIDLFERGRELTQLQWTKNGVLIRPEDDVDWEEAEEIRTLEVEGVEFYDFTGSIFEFNIDTEQMAELGYRAFFIPGGGIVVENPETPVVLAAARFIEDLQGILGTYAPERLNSWAEYAAAVPNLERAFALAGVVRHEREKREQVAAMVDSFLSGQAELKSKTGTIRADEMPVNIVLEAVDVRWWSHSPEREVFVVTAVSPAGNGMLAVTFSTKYGMERTRLVRPDRRFLVAVQ